MGGWYVYAVLDEPDASTVDTVVGIDGVPVRVVPSAGLAAVTSPVELAGFRAARERPDLREDGWLAGALRAHHRVVEDVFARAPVLPVRFGAVCASEADVVVMLSAFRERLRAGLAAVAGAGEWEVRLAAADPPAPDPSTSDGEPLDGTAWMLRRRARARRRQETGERRRLAAGLVRDTLARHARDTYEVDGVARFVCLVRRADEEAFHRAADGLRGPVSGAGLRLDLDGPRAPFHFAQRGLARPDPPVEAERPSAAQVMDRGGRDG
ncbi:GvpL/GvpF family gas vesicle protein [Phytohabitans sp. ZYX-F-186]|uniref:GvpL/GvpF family gas vesicle protein n=1 Tax=Phytohabitans maris TaxID=3071409 RepID=A0ABU0ZTX6_9ACTN|nr:GvpL/GvpF family gas vesicle protein [Phytohabitans sp. ZYX-F-186]MDQ7910437.1 GvpL/GvpF family gas vesicle protein [Phytohabitans sp. ZYX-F-186]